MTRRKKSHQSGTPNRPRIWGKHAVAAAFGATGIVTQDRHSPLESGVVAKAASGALERVPWARVVNLARALDEIGEAGFWRIGLAGDTETDLREALGSPRVALVLGAEG